MNTSNTPKYKRILLKMSGEALMGDQAFGLDAKVVRRIASEIRQLVDAGVEVAIVVGGGNLFRGAQLAALGMERVTGDHMGMLATLMNALAIQDALEQIDGTGNPFFTTDSAASLRAIELEVDAMFKATKVDGVYSKDPKRFDDAVKYDALSYRQVLTENLNVMDATSVVMCRDNDMPMVVFDMTKPDEIVRAVFDDGVGTVIHA